MSKSAVTRIQAIVIIVVIVAAVISVSAYWYVTTPTPTPKPPPPKEVVIGAVFPLSGAMARLGEWAMRGVTLAVEQINAEGGVSIGGVKVPIELVWADTTSDTTLAVAETERLIAFKRPCAMIGAYASGITYAIQPVTERNQISLFTVSAADDITLRGFKYIFRMNMPNSKQAFVLVETVRALFQEHGLTLKKICGLWDKGIYGETYAKPAKALCTKYGIEYHEIRYDIGTKDFSPIVMEIKQFAPDIVASCAYLADGALLVRTMVELGAGDIRVYLTDFPAQGDEGIEVMGEAAEGKMGNSVCWGGIFRPSEPMEKVKKEYQERWKEPLNICALEYYNVLWLMKIIIEEAGSTDSKVICETAHRIAIPNTQQRGTLGLLYPKDVVSWDALGDCNGINHGICQCIDGKWEIIWPEEFKTAEFRP